MSPGKRPAPAAPVAPAPRASSPDTDRPPPAAKRQRVSLACNACRAARERCDGLRPQCGPCRSQGRSCSYTPASKKRGVQTGYLRAVELSLAWLLEQVPGCDEALHGLLTNADGALVVGKDHASDSLHARWSRSRAHRDIGRALSDGPPRPAAASPEGYDSEASHHDAPPELRAPAPSAPLALAAAGPTAAGTALLLPPRLPANWRHLVRVHLAYTHCWFPIVDEERLMATAAQYGHGPMPAALADADVSCSRHAELWAVLAAAAFQDAHSCQPSTDATFPPPVIFAVSRGLLPHDDGILDVSNMCALLLHALILVGRRSDFAASLLVRRAARLLRHLEAAHDSSRRPLDLQPIFDACATLDMVTSACLGEAPWPSEEGQPAPRPSSPSPPRLDYVPWTGLWSPVCGFGSPSLNAEAASVAPTLSPLATINQLRRLASMLAIDACAGRGRLSPGRKTTPDDLVRCLRPQFGFCNSVISGGSTPMLPSAHLVKMLFLATIIQLVPGPRASLLSSFLEAVEACIAHFGACGTSPVAVSLMRLVQKRDCFGMPPSERSRWDAASSMLSGVWTAEADDGLRLGHPRTAVWPGQRYAGLADDVQPFAQGPLSSTASSDVPAITPGYGLLSADMMASQPQALEQLVCTSSALDKSATPLQRPLLDMLRQPDVAASNHGIDYDAILEELGTIDFTDNIEVDSQFMLNLGFAPGCDLGEMFHGDFVG